MRALQFFSCPGPAMRPTGVFSFYDCYHQQSLHCGSHWLCSLLCILISIWTSNVSHWQSMYLACARLSLYRDLGLSPATHTHTLHSMRPFSGWLFEPEYRILHLMTFNILFWVWCFNLATWKKLYIIICVFSMLAITPVSLSMNKFFILKRLFHFISVATLLILHFPSKLALTPLAILQDYSSLSIAIIPWDPSLICMFFLCNSIHSTLTFINLEFVRSAGGGGKGLWMCSFLFCCDQSNYKKNVFALVRSCVVGGRAWCGSMKPSPHVVLQSESPESRDWALKLYLP